jgi:hypothetical protein
LRLIEAVSNARQPEITERMERSIMRLARRGMKTPWAQPGASGNLLKGGNPRVADSARKRAETYLTLYPSYHPVIKRR